MKIVRIDEFEQNGGEFALKGNDILVILTGANSGEVIDGEMGILPNHSETDKDLRQIFLDEI